MRLRILFPVLLFLCLEISGGKKQWALAATDVEDDVAEAEPGNMATLLFNKVRGHGKKESKEPGVKLTLGPAMPNNFKDKRAIWQRVVRAVPELTYRLDPMR